VIRLVFSTDARGFRHPATVIASIVRRTEAAVVARVYTRGFSAGSFRSGRLEVEFVRCEEEVTGNYPGHVGEAVFDRLRIIRDEREWDRVLVLDHDMLVFADLAEYFAEPFEGNLLLGRLFGKDNTLGFQLRDPGDLPAGWRHAADYPYFFMGPMMNLAAMREEGIWERLLEAHRAIGRDEQMSLTAACGGRVRAAAAKWNLVPEWDGFPMAPGEEHPTEGVEWLNGVPLGLVHWTGPAKPWHYQTRVWRPDLWESELCGWEELAGGLWKKPLAVEVGPVALFRAEALVRRGWRVEVCGGDGLGKSSHPDMRVTDGNDDPADPAEVELLRFGPGTLPGPDDRLPARFAAEGPRTGDEIRMLRDMGYQGESRIVRDQWAFGGPHPEVLPFGDPGVALALAGGEDCYFSRLGDDRIPAATPEACAGDPAGEPAGTLASVIIFYGRNEPEWGAASVVLTFGIGMDLIALAERFAQTRFLALEHDPRVWRQVSEAARGWDRVEVFHRPFDPAVPWYDMDGLEIPPLDGVIVGGCPARGMTSSGGALCVANRLKPGSLVALLPDGWNSPKADAALWLGAGLKALRSPSGAEILRCGARAAGKLRVKRRLRNIPRAIGRIYLATAGGREKPVERAVENWRAAGLEFDIARAAAPDPASLRWEEMKGLEGYGRMENLRGGYVIEAVGIRRACVAALERFLESGARCCMVGLDSCRWRPGAMEALARSMAQLPDDWDLFYPWVSAGASHQPFDTSLTRLSGGRGAAAVVWRRETALALLPGLAACGCELDVFLERARQELAAYCAVPMPAYQAVWRSPLVGGLA
jgi:hypothetical protein